MTEQEVKALLAIVVAYDNRRPTTANITAWQEQADRNRWGFDEAREAIHRHFGESTEFLMPAHVTAIIRAQRQLPERLDRQALESAPAAQPERVAAVVAQLADRFGWRRTGRQNHDDPALAVDCPHCRVPAGKPCARLVTRGPHRGEYRPLSRPHPSRVDLVGD